MEVTMMFQGLVFYLFASLIVVSAVMVIVARNPVHAVLFLILAFLNASGLFLLVGAEFLAMVLVIVYVGAVAVLFLFVVMMLDVGTASVREGFLQYFPVGGAIGVVLLAELFLVFGSGSFSPELQVTHALDPIPPDVSNVEALGQLLYTKYAYLLQMAGLLLLVSIVGAITLTLHPRTNIKRQSVSAQVGRRGSVVLHQVPPYSGAED